MSETNPPDDRSLWAIGGGALLGLGVGFFFFPQSVFGVTSVFAFTGCLFVGTGLGLLLAAVLSSKRKPR